MSWVCELTQDAQEDLNKLPRTIQERVARVVKQLETDPFLGNVKALKGDDWQGAFRRRIGSYRIIFIANRNKHTVSIIRILIRSGKTYR